MELRQDCRDSVIGGVGFYDRFQVRVEMTKDVGSLEGGLDQVEGIFCCLVPFEGGIFLEQLRHGQNDTGVTFDEASVEIGEAEELLDVSDFGRGWPGEY